MTRVRIPATWAGTERSAQSYRLYLLPCINPAFRRPKLLYISSSGSTTMSAISRPSSAASHRPHSRVSNRPQSRPQSRHSHHPSSRLSARILPQCRQLVTLVTGEADYEEDRTKKAISIVLGKIDNVNKQGESIDMRTALMHLRGCVIYRICDLMILASLKP